MTDRYLAPNLRMDLASPEATEARRARIRAARECVTIRAQSIEAAQQVYSKHKLRGDKEIKRALENIAANLDLSQDEWIRERITEICCDIENNAQPPELPAGPYSGKERGQYDSQTVGVLHRG